MLTIEDIDGADALFVVSDDANTENVALEEAIKDYAPHLYNDFHNTGVEDGVLKWRVQAADYYSLLEVLDALDGVDPDELNAALMHVEAKAEEVTG